MCSVKEISNRNRMNKHSLLPATVVQQTTKKTQQTNQNIQGGKKLKRLVN